MSPRLKILLIIAGTLILGTGASAAWYATHQQPKVPLFVDDATPTYTLTARASEQCNGNEGAKILVNEPCQVFLDAETLGEDPTLTVMWYDITNGKKLLVADQDAPFSYAFGVQSKDNGVHTFQAELIKDAAPAKILARSNRVEVQVKIVTEGCGEGTDAVAVIPDANLKAAIRAAIAKETNTNPTEEVDCALLQSLTKLDASRRNIHSLVGLEHAISLIDLNLSENAIADFSQISTLKNLTNLNLNNTGVVDVSFVGGLLKLKELYVGNNVIKNIEVLTRLADLKLLSLGKNALESIAPLQKIGSLSAGTLVTVVRNPLNWTAASEARKTVEALKQKGVTVDFDDLSVTLTGKPVGGVNSANMKVKEGTNVELTAKPVLKNTVAEAQIAKVELFENGKFVIALVAPTYKHVARIAVGTFEYKVKVTTNDGAFAESSKIVVTGEKKKETTPVVPVSPHTDPPVVPPVVVPPVNDTCLNPYVDCAPGDPQTFTPAQCVFGLENPSCGIPIIICDSVRGCYKNDPQKTPFSFDGCNDLKNYMNLGSTKNASGSQIPLPANKMCGGENFCKRILLCAK